MIRWSPIIVLAGFAACITVTQPIWLADLTTPTIRFAEAVGANFPREAHPEYVPEDFNPGTTVGTPTRKCVNVPVSSRAVWRRSGEIIVGGSIGALKPGVKKKVPWATMHDPSARKATVVVQGVRLDEPDVTARFASTNYGYPVVGESARMDHAFFPTGFVLPSAGRWLLTVTSGNDWGCFIVTVST